MIDTEQEKESKYAYTKYGLKELWWKNKIQKHKYYCTYKV